jgi:hypothetical protein
MPFTHLLTRPLQLAQENGESKSAGVKGFDTRFDPSNDRRSAVIRLPSSQRFRDGSLSGDDLNIGALSIASNLLHEVSLLPSDRFYEILNERFSRGLQNKLLIGAPYNHCLRKFVSEEVFDNSQR